jgi:hypothetical protein
MFYSMIVVGEILAMSQFFCKTPFDFVVFLDTIVYII